MNIENGTIINQSKIIFASAKADKQTLSSGGNSQNFARIFSVSPDGRKIVFIRNKPSNAESKIVIRDLPTNEEFIPVSVKDKVFQSVAFSPDGKKIAVFVSNSDGKIHLV